MKNRPISLVKTLASIAVFPLSLVWQLLTLILLSPWGLVIPLTLLIALVAFQQVQKSPERLAQFYAQKLESSNEAELHQLTKILLQIGDAGIPGLVQGLTSEREAVFDTCLNVLQHQFEIWQNSEQREHHFRILANALLQYSGQFSHAGQTEAFQFVDQMMQVPCPEGNMSISPKEAADRHEVIVLCGAILNVLESRRQRRNDPTNDAFTHQTDSLASLYQRTHQPILLASNGQPFGASSGRQDAGQGETLFANAVDINPFNVSRPDRLLAHQKSQQSQPASGRLGDAGTVHDQNPFALATFTPSAHTPSAQTADIEQKFARNVSIHSASQHPSPPFDISEDYRHHKQSESINRFQTDSFLTPELQNMPLEQIPILPSAVLMKLLHHTDTAYIESARRTLVSRDGFQETHLRLAWRLYHPVSAVRRELLSILPNTPNVQPAVWLSVLLNDPDNEVRFQTASFLATTNDPALRRLLIERGKRDSDVRIINLANRLDSATKR